jgi:hypothetical protein
MTEKELNAIIKRTSEKDLNAIEARANAATPGPWSYATAYVNAGKEDIALLYSAFGDGTIDEFFPNAINNAAFIAHARQDVPVLLAHVRTFYHELRQVRQELIQAYEEQTQVYRKSNMCQRHVYQGVLPENLRRFYRDVDQELTRAMECYPRLNSAHEAYAVILEEVEELWQEVKVKQAHRDHAAMRKEAVQIAAMVARLVVDVLEKQE